MDNQHRKIKGYRDLSQDEIDMVNEIKEMGVKLGELAFKVRTTENVDYRWANIGETDLQTGLMALTRSITNPDFF